MRCQQLLNLKHHKFKKLELINLQEQLKVKIKSFSRTSLVTQRLKRMSTMWETRVQSLVWEDPLEKEMAIHSSTISWKTPWTEEPGRLQSTGSQSRTRLSDFTTTISLSCIGEGNGNPLQCSCLENPRDGGAWQAAVCGAAQSRTRLERLSSSSSQYSCLENLKDRVAWWITVHQVAKRRT